MLAVWIATWAVGESDLFAIADDVEHLRLYPRSYKAAPSVPLALLGVFVDVLGEYMDAEGTGMCWKSHSLVSSKFVPVCEGISGSSKRSAMNFQLAVCLTP